MTSRHEWLSTGRLSKIARTSIAGAALAAVTLTLSPAGPAAFAEPNEKPETVAEAKALVQELRQQSAGYDQKYVAAQEKYDKAKKSLASKKRDLAEQQAEVDELRKAVAAIALAQYQNRGIDTTTKLVVSPSPEVLLRDLGLQQRMSVRQRTTLQDYQTELANLADLRRSAETDSTGMEKALKEMDQARKESKSKLSEAEHILQQLTEEQRRRLEAQRRAEAEEARRAAEAAEQEQQEEQQQEQARQDDSQRRTTSNSRSNDRKSTSEKSEPKKPSVPVSGRAAAAVASAKSKLGAPYVYGGTGPGYDCSGLTMTSWAAAGASIGRTTGAQWAGLQPISRGQLKPGDLVFYYGNITHVGMYVGNGTVIHAPNSTTVVKYAPMDSMPVSGYRRVV